VHETFTISHRHHHQATSSSSHPLSFAYARAPVSRSVLLALDGAGAEETRARSLRADGSMSRSEGSATEDEEPQEGNLKPKVWRAAITIDYNLLIRT